MPLQPLEPGQILWSRPSDFAREFIQLRKQPGVNENRNRSRPLRSETGNQNRARHVGSGTSGAIALGVQVLLADALIQFP